MNIHVGPADVQEGLMVDVPNEKQPACPNRTKTDVSFRPSRDVMYHSWTSKGPQSYIFLVKILKILVGPNENLNREKLINRF